MRTFSGLENKTMETTNIHTNYQQQSISSNNYSTSLNLKFARSNTSPNRTMTNGSIMNGNFNRYYHGGNEVNGNGNLNNQNMKMEAPGEDKFEVPLPFGYHLDLDFLRVCDGESNSEETIQKLKELKKTRRKQRKELEALMGIKQEQKDREKKFNDLPGRTRQSINIKTPPRTLNLGGDQTPDIINSSELVREALRESMLSFQETLDQYKEQDLSGFDLISTSTPVGAKKANKFATFPRIQNLGSPDDLLPAGKLSRQLSNSSISSISTSSSALPYNTPLTPEAYLASLPSSVMPKPDEMETNSIGSISSDMSTTTLRNIREQMARSLVKLKEYEKQVEAIPMLQVKLSVLKEEKRLLMLKLKAREAKLRRDRGEMYESDGYLDSQLFDEDMDTDDEDLDSRVAKMSNSLNRKYLMMSSSQSRRARSESPYAKCTTVHPEDFISFQRKRSTSCGFNSDSSDVSPSGARKYYTDPAYNQDSTEFAGRNGKFSRNPGVNDDSKTYPQIQLKDQGVNTDQVAEVKPDPPKPVLKVFTKEKSSNTDPQPRSPPAVRKVNHGTNTLKVRSIPKGTGTDIKMSELMSKEEVESKIQDAVFRTEEEIMSCPLLQKAMQKVEEEALKGEEPSKEFLDSACQVGEENLRPFVIDIGVMCKIGDDESGRDRKSRSVADSWCQITPPQVAKSNASCGPTGIEKMSLMRTVAVGDCKVIEDPKDPTKHRSIGICTEKWVEVIRASKQTDTEDFAFKDTESPRVADLAVDPPIELPLERRQRLSSLTSPCLRKSMSPSVSRRESMNSPSVSRKSSSTSTTQTRNVERRHKDTMTMAEVKTATKDAKVGEKVQTRSVGTSALILPLTKGHFPPGSPLTTPETEKPPVNMNLCDKCEKDIHSVAAGIISGPPLSPSPIIAPPSPDTPWVSKIPRPCPPLENPEVSRLKSATSTGNLSQRSKSPASGLPVMQRSKSNLEPVLQRSKSNLEQSPNKFSLLPSMSRTPPPLRRNMGTPPPHPNTPPVGSKRAPSPLARSPAPSMTSSYTAGDKKSLIPKFSPGLQRKTLDSSSGAAQKVASPTTENKSMIPRVVTPPALRKMFPNKPDTDKSSGGGGARDRNVVRKQTYSRGQTGVNNPDLDKIDEHPTNEASKNKDKAEDSGEETETLDDTDGPKKSSSYPLPGSALFAPIEDGGNKSEPSKEMKGALKVLNDSIGRSGSSRPNAQLTNAINIIQQEWFKTSSTKQSIPRVVEDYLDFFEEMSKELLDQVVNLADVNGNTALHYSVSHGNFDVVSILLDSKIGNANILNKAGYTCTMLVSLAVISSDTHRSVVKKLFSTADLNVRASQHGQTALMLAVSHGRLDMVDLLLEAGADVNIRDEDGSTALMCAAEHGHMEIVKLLMRHPDININATDNDGLSALSVAMEAGHRDIGVILYANMSFSRGASPHSSMRMKKGVSRESVATPTGSVMSGVGASSVASPVPPTPPHRSRRNSSNM